MFGKLLPKGLARDDRKFIRNLATFMGGRGAAVLIAFLLTPVIARLFEPEHWGVSALFLAICGAIGPIAALHYERAIPVVETDAEAFELLVLGAAVSVAVITILILLTIAAVLGDFIPATMAGLSWWLWLIPIGVALESSATLLQAWLLRFKRYRSLAASEIAQSLGRAGLRLGIGLTRGSSVSGLVGTYLLGYWPTLSVLLRGCRRDAALRGRVPNWRELVSLGRRFRDFPIYNAPTGFLMQATRQVPLFVLATYFGPAAAGFFSMADRLIRTPVHVATNTLRQVFLQRIAEVARSGRSIRPYLFKTVSVMAAVILLPALVMFTLGQEITVFLLGSKWTAAGAIVEIMAPYLFVQFLGGPFQGAAIVMRQQKLWFVLQTVAAASRLVIVPVAIFLPTTAYGIVAIYVWTTVATQALALVIMGSRAPSSIASTLPRERTVSLDQD